MKSKVLVPMVILLIAGFSILFAQNKPDSQLLKNQKTQNEAIHEIITHPQMMQNFMQQLTDNHEP